MVRAALLISNKPATTAVKERSVRTREVRGEKGDCLR